MDLQLTDKVVVVTGAASGIGQAIARLLTEEGAVVAGVDRNPVGTGL
ncbi:SDR family NAD(P)-dependent oxidoreductase [Streptomyces sp. NPDC086549]